VAVGLPGGGADFVGASQIAGGGDVAPRTYTLRARPGEPGEQITHGGLSVRGLLRIAGLDPDRIGFVTVPRADGTTAYLPGSDFAEPPPFPEGPALVWVDSNATHLFRPVLGPEDANAADNIATPGGEALALRVSDGALLSVRAEADPDKASVGQRVSFSAAASGALGGEAISYRWDFGEGAGAEGQRVSHAFEAPGSYEVAVTASGSRESGGVSEPLAIVVGNPPEAGGAGASPRHQSHSAGTPHGTSGRGGAGHGGGAGSGSTGKGGGSHSGSFPRRGAAPGQGAARPSLASPSPAHGHGAGRPPHVPHAREAPPAADQQTVRGFLVADTLQEPRLSASQSSSAQPGGRGSRPSAERGSGYTLPVAALLAATLLLAGALAEHRGLRIRLS
jgi:hypothetical protein